MQNSICLFVMFCVTRYIPLAEVAQLVEQRTENPCVGGSSPPLGTNNGIINSYSVITI